MNIAADKKTIENTLLVYRQKLDEIPDELFNITPPGGGWSYAEVYSHVMQATLLSLTVVQKCCNGTAQTHIKPTSFLARLVFLIRRLPPVKVKAPASLSSLTVNISKEEARNLIIKVKKRVDEVFPEIEGAPKYSKVKHPRLGMLNAQQWFRFTGYHLSHHLRQLTRISKKFPKR